MKKGILLAIILCGILLFTGCDKEAGSKEISGIKIYNDSTTYAYKKTFGGEYYLLVIRYDKLGNFKYLEYTDNYDLDESEPETKAYSDKELQKLAEEDECKHLEKLDYDEFKSICKVKNHIFTYGYSITDKTISSGLLNENGYNEWGILQSIIGDFKSVENEAAAKELFNKTKENLNASDGDFMIFANKKLELNN